MTSDIALRPQGPYGLLGTGSPGRPPPLAHTAPELRFVSEFLLLNVHGGEKAY